MSRKGRKHYFYAVYESQFQQLRVIFSSEKPWTRSAIRELLEGARDEAERLLSEYLLRMENWKKENPEKVEEVEKAFRLLYPGDKKVYPWVWENVYNHASGDDGLNPVVIEEGLVSRRLKELGAEVIWMPPPAEKLALAKQIKVRTKYKEEDYHMGWLDDDC